MARVYVGVGSNVDRFANIRSGILALRRSFGELILSSVYDNAAEGFTGDNFFNLVAGFDSLQPVREVVEILRTIEQLHGRRRERERFVSRTLDLDLLLYDDLIIKQGDLHIPRDEITRYAFILCPLAEVAPDMPHPMHGLTFRELWSRFEQGAQPLLRVDIAL